jgi:WD40 repeat protein
MQATTPQPEGENKRSSSSSSSSPQVVRSCRSIVDLQPDCSHASLRDGLRLSSVDPNILYFTKTNEVALLNLQTLQQEVVHGSFSMSIATGGGYLVASNPFQKLATIIEETTKRQVNTLTSADRGGLSIYKFGDECRLITTCTEDPNTVEIWKLPELQLVQTIYSTFQEYIKYYFACVSPDGQHLALSGGPNKSAEVYTLNPDTGLFENPEAIELFETIQTAVSCAWDPTSRYLAVAASNCAVFDIQSKSRIKLLLNAETCRATLVQFSPNPLVHLLVIGLTDTADFWDRVCFVNTRTWEEQIVPIRSNITGIAFSADGRNVYIGIQRKGIFEYGVPDVDVSLKGLCISCIKNNKDKWMEFGWDLSSLPADLQPLF